VVAGFFLENQSMRSLLTVLVFALAIPATVCMSQVPGVVIDHQAPATREYIGSPSILKAPNGDYIATHDLFGPGSPSTTSAESKVFVSKDRGATWTQTASFHEQFWSNLFVQKNRIYLMGASAEYGRIVIRTSDDNGASWSEAHYLTSDTGYHTAPVPMITRNGCIYRAFEFHPAGPWGSFQAFMMSAPANSDLTDPKSWSFSKSLNFPANVDGNAWLEGNAVVGPDGSILDVLRVNNLERAAILRLDGDELKLQSFVDFPGGAKKFTIRFDPQSKLYWTLSNPALPGEPLAVSAPASVRNTLVVMSSPDLKNWTPRSIVLHHPDSIVHAFQYTDWQFDGTDLIVASRTAVDDQQGSAHTYHDANYLTFHRVSDFRNLGKIALQGKPFSTAEVASSEQMQKWMASIRNDASKTADGAASQPIGRYGTHTTTLTTRIATGIAEQHRDWCDIFVVVAGEATLRSGGELVGAHTVADGEMRGSAVSGGSSQRLTPGSVVHIDPHIPHQLVLDSGMTFTYFVVKARATTGM
jgi:hypothetical protein